MYNRLLRYAGLLFFFGVLLVAHDVIQSRAAMWQWSKTSGNNANADSTINWAEGMPPGVVNDSARAMMARLAEWRDDTSGLLVTAGTSTAYTLTTNQSTGGNPIPTTPNNGQMVCFAPHVTNGAASTLSVDLGTAFAIQTSPGIAVLSSSLILGTPYCASFNSANSAWILFGVSPAAVPLGTVLDFTGSAAPSSNFALAFGQAISRTTFANYFALVGTTYGIGDGATTFNIPDLRGRVVAGQDNMGGSAAGRIGSVVTDNGTITGTTLGSAGGSSTHVQTSGELATHTHTATSTPTDPGHVHNINVTFSGNGGGIGGFVGNVGGSYTNTGLNSLPIIQSSTTGVTVATTNANAGSSAAMALLQPTAILTKIVRVQHHDDAFMVDALGAANDNTEFWFPARAVGE